MIKIKSLSFLCLIIKKYCGDDFLWMWLYSFISSMSFDQRRKYWNFFKVIYWMLNLNTSDNHWPWLKSDLYYFLPKVTCLGNCFVINCGWLVEYYQNYLLQYTFTADSSGDSSDDSGEFMNPKKRSSGFTTKLQIKPCHQCIGLKRTQLVMVSHCFCTWT